MNEFDEEDVDDEVTLSPRIQHDRFETFVDSFLLGLPSLNDLYEPSPMNDGAAISRNNRSAAGYASTTLSYSEIDFESFGLLIFKIFKDLDLDTNNEQITFVDIGCGTGKAVFCAYMMNIFGRVVGIEILPDLHKSCQMTLRHYTRHFLSSVNDVVNVEFLLGDASYIDWSRHDVAFAFASAFDTAVMDRLADIANRMKFGAIFISVTNRWICVTLLLLCTV